MIIGIDVGNTAIKIAVQGESDVVVRRVSDHATMDTILKTLWNYSQAETAEVRIASVNRATANELITQTRAVAGDAVRFRQITWDDLPIAIATEHPERVGIDRLVGALGASYDYQRPLVVVDAGTTVTVDLVDTGAVYRGGAIVPGLEMQTAALAAGTDALPQINWQGACQSQDLLSPQNIPALDTVAAIRLGILSSVVGGIQRLVELYGNPQCVVVTGGDGDCVAAGLRSSANPDFDVELHPHLVCRTLANLDSAALSKTQASSTGLRQR
ncbi:type III pantothenate kinase [Allorhodopirellula solitaria]|uniref:Type III pantothenate kinase n=1 Tax=Allorhodopirellula solitaria TaxID=2527987 RepID=A0A5C5YCG3_9BACT|nr:type III pantothenate kinase [Allorhodopirellula solitaria]TWT73396.1 Type III pantothenate kinase [Allorhodopirellula solitaria]